MTLILKIDQNEKYEFFEKYDTLSPLRKKIWKKIVWASRTMIIPYPSQSKVAEWCKCSRSAVSEAFRLFKEWGWLALLSRGWKKSKTIIIPHVQKQIDVYNREWFKRIEATHEATHTYINNKRNTSRGTGGFSDGLYKPIQVPIYLKRLKSLPLEDKLKLSMVPEHIYQESLYSARYQASKGTKFKDEIGYVAGTAIRMAKKRKIHLPWRQYYQSIEYYKKESGLRLL